MPIDLKCGEGKRVYQNRSKQKTLTVTVTVNDKCKGNDGPTVVPINPKGEHETDNEEVLVPGGGAVSFDVPPGGGLWVDCKGEGEHGCSVEIATCC